MERIDGGRLTTFEGNINEALDPGRDGVGVYRSSRRTVFDEHLVGMICYSGANDEAG